MQSLILHLKFSSNCSPERNPWVIFFRGHRLEDKNFCKGGFLKSSKSANMQK